MMTSRAVKLAALAAAIATMAITGCASRSGSQTAAPPPPAVAETKPAPAAAQAAPATPAAKPAAQAFTGKVLVLGGPLPADVAHDVLGRVEVFQRSYGGVGESYKMLGDKGREVGANAIIESRVWLAPAGIIMAAPHGAGIAVRVKDSKRLETIGTSGGRWE